MYIIFSQLDGTYLAVCFLQGRPHIKPVSLRPGAKSSLDTRFAPIYVPFRDHGDGHRSLLAARTPVGIQELREQTMFTPLHLHAISKSQDTPSHLRSRLFFLRSPESGCLGADQSLCQRYAIFALRY